MKFTIVGLFTTALALAGAVYAVPLASGESDSVQLRAEETVSELLSRSFEEQEDIFERSEFDSDILEYTTRSYEDGGELFYRALPLDNEVFERSNELSERDEAPVEFSHLARSDVEDVTLFGREEELMWGREFDGEDSLVARSKIGNFFKKIWHGIKKVGGAIVHAVL